MARTMPRNSALMVNAFQPCAQARRRSCIALIAYLALVLVLVPSAVRAEMEAAYVHTKVALARSGPGMEHYATDALTVGDMVEIIDRQNGWVAIHPPLNAYCWIAENKLRKLSDSEAEVSAEHARAWLGSDVEQVSKHVSQIELRRGERVQILGQKEVPMGSDATEVWLKIKPPIGERRWVRESELSDSPPLRSARNASTAGGLAMQEDGWTGRGNRSGATSLLGEDVPSERARHNSSRSSFIDARQRLENFEDEVARLQLAITRAATDLASLEELNELEEEIEALVDAGRTPLQRGQATRLLQSADELKKLAEQREELGLSEDEPRSEPEKKSDEKRPLARFAVKGWLMPVAWYGRPTELCAIMNDEHTPIAFVSPAPGVNLRRYLNKEVGIIGEESFNKIHDKRHVVAHRVVELSRHRDAKPETFANVPWIRFRSKQQAASLADLMSEDLKEPDVQVD